MLFTCTTAQSNFANVYSSDMCPSDQVTGLATNGTLKYNGAAVTLNQVITAADISSGLLTFDPAADQNGAPSSEERRVGSECRVVGTRVAVVNGNVNVV